MTHYSISQRSGAAPRSAMAPPGFQDMVHLLEYQELTASLKTHGVSGNRQLQQLRLSLPAELLRCYEHAAAHGRPAVAAMTATGACGGCHLTLPAGLARNLRLLTDSAIHCPHCGCFLFWPHAAPAKPKRRQASRRIVFRGTS